MKPSIAKRLCFLEARPEKGDPQQAERFRVAVAALLDAYSLGTNWQQLLERPSDLEALRDRLKAGTATDADRAALAGLPVCHVPPEQLVAAAASLVAPGAEAGGRCRGDTKWQG